MYDYDGNLLGAYEIGQDVGPLPGLPPYPLSVMPPPPGMPGPWTPAQGQAQGTAQGAVSWGMAGSIGGLAGLLIGAVVGYMLGKSR